MDQPREREDESDLLSTLEVIQLLESDPDRAAATRQDFVDFVSAMEPMLTSARP